MQSRLLAEFIKNRRCQSALEYSQSAPVAPANYSRTPGDRRHCLAPLLIPAISLATTHRKDSAEAQQRSRPAQNSASPFPLFPRLSWCWRIAVAVDLPKEPATYCVHW